jgi:hypothetical protein
MAYHTVLAPASQAVLQTAQAARNNIEQERQFCDFSRNH